METTNRNLDALAAEQTRRARWLSEDSLAFVKADCLEALAANPMANKAVEYLLLAQACEAEEGRRQMKRESETRHWALVAAGVRVDRSWKEEEKVA